MPVPLDKMTQILLDSDKPQPSLHPSRIEKMVFVRYIAPPSSCDNRADYDAWMERVAYLCDDLHWLLQLPHDTFWCQAIFDNSLHKALDSFLRYCPRLSEALVSFPEVAKQRHVELCRLVFMVYLRLSTHKESKDHFITSEVFGQILYENFLFDIPKIFDICSLYGKTNRPLLNKMLSNVFTQQPNYIDDLRMTLPTVLQVLGNISTKCGICLDTIGSGLQRLEDAGTTMSLRMMSTQALHDTVLYLNDTADTLHRFLDVYPPACAVFYENGFCSIIANFYECVTPELSTTVKQHEFTSPRQKKHLTIKLQQAKKSILTVFHEIMNQTCLLPVIENASNCEKVASCIEDFLHTMTSVLSERRFLAAYEGMFSFQDDADLLMQTSIDVDSSQLEYIQTAINSAFTTFGRRKSPHGDTNTGGRTSPDGAPDSASAAPPMPTAVEPLRPGDEDWGGARPKTGNTITRPLQDYPENYGEGAMSAPRPSDVEITSQISSVKDLFPHFGDGFLELALEECDWDTEKVVACVLEDKLPPSLQDISPDLAREEREVHQADGRMADLPDVLESRKNVFDNDEFDMFGNEAIDMSKIHIGKKEAKVDLDDKSFIKAFQATYDAYGSMDKDSMYDNSQMYEDEYDDTYDTSAVGAGDADSADELTNKKVLPRILQELERKKAKVEGRENESDASDDDTATLPTGDEFVANPAKLRDEAQMRWHSQTGARGRQGRGGGGPPRNRDVVGGAKGHGQSKDVQHDRKIKAKFKGQRNRANAEKKMSKGMF